MRQAKTLKDAEIKRVLAYCATRQHALRDTTIFVFSLHAGLRAKELAALRICDVYDDVGNVHSSFVLSAAATKGARTRTVYVNKTLKRQLAQYYPTLPKQPTAPLFCSQKGSFFSANTMCQLLIHIFQQCSLKTRNFTQRQTHVYYTLGKQRRWSACACRTCWAQQHCDNTTLH